MTIWKGGIAIMAASLSLSGAARAKVELLGQPCRAKNSLSAVVVTSPKDGVEYYVLANMNEDSGAELLFVDYKANKGKLFRAPAGAGAWALREVPGNRLVVGTFYDGMFMVFDLNTMEWIKTIPFPGEKYIWNFAMGKDGRLYGGTYPGGKLGALDLATYEVEDCGAPSPGNMYLRYVTATPDGRIFCQFGMEKNTTLIYDPDTKKFTRAPEYMQDVTRATLWNGYFIAENRIFKGADLTPVKELPFPLPEGVKNWSVSPALTTETSLVFTSNGAVYRYRPGDKAAELLSDADLRGGGFNAISPEGNLMAVRGPDYGWARPGQKGVDLKTIPVESGPRPTMFLSLDPKGRIWGGPTFGQTLFWLDPKTREYRNTGLVSNHGGEVYDTAFIGETAYSAAYVGGEVIRYDTNKPFDQFQGKNPRTIAKVAPEYIRPQAGIAVGADGKLYAGWMAKYGAYGGALSITDPKTEKTELVENPLGAQGLSGVAVSGDQVFIGSTTAANGLKNNPEGTAQFGVMDISSHKITFQQAFPDAGSVHHIGYDAATGRVAMVVAEKTGSRVAIYDPKAGKMVEGLPDAPPGTSASASTPGDGYIYYGSGNRVLALDLKTGEAGTVEQTPASVDHIVADKDGNVYVSCGVNIYRVRGARGK
jgi:streptogramin lyase